MSNRNFPKGEPVRFRDRFVTVLRWCHWPSLISGAAIGFAALHLHTTSTLLSDVKHLKQQIGAVDSRVHELAGSAQDAGQANDLLAVLVAQGERVTAAREALDSMTNLQRGLASSGQETDEASAIAERWHDLAGRLIASQTQHTQSAEAIAEIDALQQDVIALGGAAAAAQLEMDASRTILTDVANLQSQLAATAETTDSARSAINGIDDLQQRLVAAIEQTEAAQQSATGLIGLQQSLTSAADVEAAAGNAERLIALQQSLSADPRLNLDVATQNAEMMVAMQESLSGQTGQIAASIENLELLADFQDELTVQMDQVEALRRQLTELMLLETTLSRTMSALAPLTDLGNLRRLDEADVREVARTMLDRRRERVAAAESKYDSEDATTIEAGDDDRLVPEPPTE